MSNTPNIHPNDYVLFKTPKEGTNKFKFFLLKASNITSEEVYGRVEISPHVKPQMVSVPNEFIIANLGKKPLPGKLYGVDTSSLFKKTVTHAEFGDVHFFCKPDAANMSKLNEAFGDVYKMLKKAKLGFLLEEETVFEVVDHGFTKYSGQFRMFKNREKNPSRITVCCDVDALKGMGIDSYNYVLAHELGHALHFHHVQQNKDLDATWVRAYKGSIFPKQISKELMDSLKAALLSERSIRAALAIVPEEDMTQAKAAFKTFRSVTGYSAREIDLLLEQGKDKTVSSIWPNMTFVDAERKSILTLYATKNYRELFAETFAFWLTKATLPPNLQELMDKTVSLCRNNPTATQES